MTNELQKSSDYAENVKYIANLNLGEHKYGHPETQADGVIGLRPDNFKDSYIIGGGMAIFTENVKGQVKQDILNATLLAQLAANKKYDRERNTKDWYREYNGVLGNIGFVIEDFEFDMYSPSESYLSLDTAVLDIIGSLAIGNEIRALTVTLDAMRKLSTDDKKIELLDTQGSDSSCGNFQVYPCSQAPDGEVSLSLGVFFYKAVEKHTNFLFFKWSSITTQLCKGVQKAVFKTEVYATLRSAIIDKLGDNASNFLASIDIWGSSIALPFADMFEY